MFGSTPHGSVYKEIMTVVSTLVIRSQLQLIELMNTDPEQIMQKENSSLNRTIYPASGVYIRTLLNILYRVEIVFSVGRSLSNPRTHRAKFWVIFASTNLFLLIIISQP